MNVLILYYFITFLFPQTWCLKTITILLHFLILWADWVQLSGSFASRKSSVATAILELNWTRASKMAYLDSGQLTLAVNC